MRQTCDGMSDSLKRLRLEVPQDRRQSDEQNHSECQPHQRLRPSPARILERGPPSRAARGVALRGFEMKLTYLTTDPELGAASLPEESQLADPERAIGPRASLAGHVEFSEPSKNLSI